MLRTASWLLRSLRDTYTSGRCREEGEELGVVIILGNVLESTLPAEKTWGLLTANAGGVWSDAIRGRKKKGEARKRCGAVFPLRERRGWRGRMGLASVRVGKKESRGRFVSRCGMILYCCTIARPG